MENYIIHAAGGVKVFSASEIIENALKQERNGITPHYALYDYVHSEKLTPAGWLVWSTLESGVGIVYRRQSDGEMIISVGTQGDFAYI